MDTPAERQLTAVLLHAATLGQHLPAAEVARVGSAVLEREPATPGHAHTALPLLVPALVAADAAHGISCWLDIALEQARGEHAVGAQVWIRVEQAMTLLGTGELRRARALAVQAHELAGAEWADAAAMSAVVLAWVAVHTRDADLTAWLLAEGEQDRFGGVGATRHTPCVTAARQMLRGWLAAAGGDDDRALEHFLECGHWLERFGWGNPALYPWRSWAADLHRRRGRLDAAAELVEQESALVTAWGAPAALGRLLRVRARLADGARAVDLLRQAVATLDASDNRLELAKASVRLGQLLRRAGDAQADHHLRRGYELATWCGVRWLADQAHAELATAGAAGLPRPRPPSAGSVLTKTEHRVASLAVHGHTNKEIADALAVSCRAVEKHLTNAYRKLAVPGRAGLAGALRALEAPETAVPGPARRSESRHQ